MICNKCGTKHLSPTENCPYDNHRQVHENNLSKIMGAIPDMPEYVKQDPFAYGFAQGFAAALQQCREAVEKVLSWRNPQFEQYGHEWDCHKDDILAAISAVEGEIK